MNYSIQNNSHSYKDLFGVEKEKYIKEVQVEGRKRTYEITEKGRLAYKEEVERLKQCVEDAKAAAFERGDIDEWKQ